jgi:hypothetical protein
MRGVGNGRYAPMNAQFWWLAALLVVSWGVAAWDLVCCRSAAAGPPPGAARRSGRVRVIDHSLVDDRGPFLGLGASYFTALWRCKNDRRRLERDFRSLSRQGFNHYRMLSMVGWYPAWEGREIAPVSFTNRSGKRLTAWPDYWRQLRELVDLA